MPLRIGRVLEFRFVKTPREELWSQLALAALVIYALVGLYLAHHMRPIWLLVLLSALTPLYRLEEVSPWVVRAARYAAFAFLGGTVVLAYIFMAYPILSQQDSILYTRLGGFGLAGFSFGFLLGTKTWRPGATLIPCVLGAFAVAAFNGAARLEGTLIVAGLAGVAYLALATPSSESAGQTALPARRLNVRVLLLLPAMFVVFRTIVWVLPRAQGRVEQATSSLFATSTTNYSGFAVQSRLGDLEQLKLSGKVVMRVWSSRPQKLRGRIFTRFDGRTWEVREAAARQLLHAPGPSALDETTAKWLEAIPGTIFLLPGFENARVAEAESIRTKIVQSGFNPGLLVSPAQKLLVRAASPVLTADIHESLATPISSTVEVYGIVNRQRGDLVQSEALELPSETLGLPEKLDPRLRALAQRLAGEAGSPEERLRHTVQFVQNECRCSLEVGKFHSQDPVEEFLFEKKRGYCEYFASAAAVLLRLQGIPCRYVTGFSVQEWNRKGGHFVVREADAHAWVEAYLPNQGWLEADPTPEAEYAARARFETGWHEDLKEWVAGELAEILIYVRRGDCGEVFRWFGQQLRAVWRVVWSPRFGIVLLLLAAVFLAARWRMKARKAQPRRATSATLARGVVGSKEAEELISFLDQLWAQKGLCPIRCMRASRACGGSPARENQREISPDQPRGRRVLLRHLFRPHLTRPSRAAGFAANA